mgnify:CR=1 FL=1
MGLFVACMVGTVVGYIVGVIIERTAKSKKESKQYRAHPGLRQELARKTNRPRYRTWSSK